MNDRYSRQILLEGFGEPAQQQLAGVLNSPRGLTLFKFRTTTFIAALIPASVTSNSVLFLASTLPSVNVLNYILILNPCFYLKFL
ncbi:hypothetical protein FHW88_005049 [Mucilaginibacter sp. SG538B]|nr:hypothetical protein [Mucilaginibacter sp. SG538B]